MACATRQPVPDPRSAVPPVSDGVPGGPVGASVAGLWAHVPRLLLRPLASAPPRRLPSGRSSGGAGCSRAACARLCVCLSPGSGAPHVSAPDSGWSAVPQCRCNTGRRECPTRLRGQGAPGPSLAASPAEGWNSDHPQALHDGANRNQRCAR